MPQKNLIAAIIFASVLMSGSLIFLGLQFKTNGSTTLASTDDFQNKINQGIDTYVKQKQAQQNQPAEEKVGTIKPVSNDDHIGGNKDAEISLIEYSDFECPFCRLFHPTTKKIIETYGGKVNLVYRHYPLSFHKNAAKEAEASECANELGGSDKFWAYADKIFERTTSNGTGFPLENLVPLAKEIGLNETKFKTCLDSGKYAKRIEKDIAEGSAAGVTGTPGNFLINHKTNETKIVSGAQPFEVFKGKIDSMLQN